MHKRKSQIFIASLLAAAMTVSAAMPAFSLTAAADDSHRGEQLCETSFDYKMLPWHTVEQRPARQQFKLEDGAVHITILCAKGWDHENWDLQFRYRKLNFMSGHTYKVSCKVKSNRAGLLLSSYIGDTGEPYHQYCTLQEDGSFVPGPHMGGGGAGWATPFELTSEWQTLEGTFECTEDLQAKEWTFRYANASGGYTPGNAQDGDEIWFDEMSICDISSGIGLEGYELEYTDRYYSRLPYNYISVNQVGYLTNLAKTATLGDDKSDVYPFSQPIELSGSYDFELVAANSDEVVFTGKTGEAFENPDSGETVCKIDFSEFKTPGRYYLRIKGRDWRSFEFEIGDNIYQDKTHDLLTNSLNFFYQNRSGTDIHAEYITSGEKNQLAHKGGHTVDTGHVQTEWIGEYADRKEAEETYSSSVITANGGWYGSGDVAKYMTEGGAALWTLQNMYERSVGTAKFDEGSGVCVVPENDNGVPDILDECKYELDFMEQMKVDASEPTWGKYAGLYYHKIQDHKWTGLALRPWIYEEEWGTVRIVKPPTFSATLNYAACAAQAARLWQKYDKDYAAKLLKNAKDAYQAFMQYYYEADMRTATHYLYHSDVPMEENNKLSLYAPKYTSDIWEHYNDNEVRDDAYWAACELFISAKAMNDADAETYLKQLSDYQDAFKVPERITGGDNNKEGSFTVFNWGNTTAAGSFSLALHEDLLTDTQKEKLNESICATADSMLSVEEQQGYGIPYKFDCMGYYEPGSLGPEIIIRGYEFGSNGRVLNNMIAMAYAYDLTSDAKYADGVVSGMNYLLGCNPLSFSFITGYGSYREKWPSHNYWSYAIDNTLPMAPDGVIVGGPTVWYDNIMRAMGYDIEKTAPNQRSYIDEIEAESCNAVSLEWNAALAWVTSFLQFDGRQISEPQYTVTTTPEPGTTTDKPAQNDTVWGDATCDGRTDVSDAVLLARYLVQDTEAVITDRGKEQANVITGTLNEQDLTVILMIIAKKITAAQLPLHTSPV